MTLFDSCENLFSTQVTILNGTNAAPPIATEGRAFVGIQMPAAWTAAKVGFEISVDGGKTWQTATDLAGAWIQAANAAASQYIAWPPNIPALFGPFLKVKSVDATNVAVNQTADRVLTLVFRRLNGGN